MSIISIINWNDECPALEMFTTMIYMKIYININEIPKMGNAINLKPVVIKPIHWWEKWREEEMWNIRHLFVFWFKTVNKLSREYMDMIEWSLTWINSSISRAVSICYFFRSSLEIIWNAKRRKISKIMKIEMGLQTMTRQRNDINLKLEILTKHSKHRFDRTCGFEIINDSLNCYKC